MGQCCPCQPPRRPVIIDVKDRDLMRPTKSPSLAPTFSFVVDHDLAVLFCKRTDVWVGKNVENDF